MVFGAAFFGFLLWYGDGGIAATGAAFKEKPVFAGKAAGRASDRGEKTAAVGAGFYGAADFLAAIVAEKTGGFFQF